MLIFFDGDQYYMPYSEIAYKIVNQVLKVKPGQVVAIISEIMNSDNRDNPLAAIPFIEELAIAIRRKKAFAVIELSTENLHKRFITEMPDEIFGLPNKFLQHWIEGIDAFIDLGFHINPELYNSIPTKIFRQIEQANIEVFKKAIDKKYITLGYPTLAMARYYNIEHNILQKMYFEGLNANYQEIKNNCNELLEKFNLNTEYNINLKNHTLKYALAKQNKIVNSTFDKNGSVSLPAGIVEFVIDTDFLAGEFLAERVYYGKNLYTDVIFEFDKGKIIAINFNHDQVKSYLLKDKLLGRKTNISISFGCNSNLSSACGYALFDECIKNSVSLKFLDYDNKPVMLALQKVD